MFSPRRETANSRRKSLVRSAGAAVAFMALTLHGQATGQEAASPELDAIAGAVQQSQYLVNAGDDLDIFVWGEERMQRAVRVQPDGTFSFPLAGTIQARDRNVTDIAAEIRERISVNYRSSIPDVTVSVRDAIGMRFYVVGKVRTPGSYTSGTSVNILQALSMAGGTAEFADIKNAVILRQTPTGQIVEPVKLSSVLKGGRAMEAGVLSNALPMLLSGDVLVIP